MLKIPSSETDSSNSSKSMWCDMMIGISSIDFFNLIDLVDTQTLQILPSFKNVVHFPDILQ